MAISTSFSNFFSILSPTKPQPHHFPLSPSLIRFPSQHNHNLRRDKLVPLVASGDNDSPEDLYSFRFQKTKPVHAEVIPEDGESMESVINRFKREVARSGILQQWKRKMFFESKRDKKKRKARAAAKRRSRENNPWRPRPGGKYPGQYEQDVPTTVKEEDSDEDDDNWDLPEDDFMLNF